MKKFILLATFALSIFIVSAQNETAKAENGPQITFKTTLHEYGEIFQDGDGTYLFEFTNTGNEPLILSKPISSCGCTVPSWPKEPILPGETNSIKVTYNTHKVGAFNKTVTVKSNAKKESSVMLRIKGTVVAKPGEAMPVMDNSSGAAPVNK
ncbi:MAG TPA: DUF1573 domain-containing protein [Bacteroidales bacterium]